MEIKASIKYLKIAPRKVRAVADLIKGMSLEGAEAQLKHLKRRSSDPLLKLLKSAAANATHNFQIDPAKLYIKNITVNQGPMLKRMFPRARGSANVIRHRLSHVDIILEEREPQEKELEPLKAESQIKKEGRKKQKVYTQKVNKKSQQSKRVNVKATKAQSKKIIQRKVIG